MKLFLKKSKIQESLLVIFFVLIYLTPDFRFLPFYTWFLALVGLFIFFNRRFHNRLGIVSKANKNFVYMQCAGIIYLGIFIPIVHKSLDFSYLILLIGMILCFFRNYLVSYIILKNKYFRTKSIYYYMNVFLWMCCICVGVTFLFIIFPSFKSFWLDNVIVNNVTSRLESVAAYEFRYSISGFVAFSYATIFSFAVIMQASLICVQKFSFKQIVRFVVICVGCFFYGRITFFAIAISIVLIFTRKKNFMKTLRMFLLLVLAVIGGSVLLIQLGQTDSRFLVWSEWAFSFVTDIFVKGEITTNSVNILLEEMYFVPEIKTFLVGDGIYTDPITEGYYMNTDVGYMRLILYAGVFGMVIAYIPILYLFFCVLKKVNDYDFRRFVVAILLMWLILEAKGESYHNLILVMYPILLLKLKEERDGIMNAKDDEKII